MFLKLAYILELAYLQQSSKSLEQFVKEIAFKIKILFYKSTFTMNNAFVPVTLVERSISIVGYTLSMGFTLLPLTFINFIVVG